MKCQKCVDLNKMLDDRNIATKVWIQSDTQCRAYAHQLEKENVKLKEELVAINKKYELLHQVVPKTPPEVAGTFEVLQKWRFIE